jgi:uncharacterized membrane protein
VSHRSFVPVFRCAISLALGLAVTVLHAQIAVTALTTTDDASAGTTTETGTNPTTLSFQNDVRRVDTFTAGGNNFTLTGAATNAYVRRNTGAGNANNSSLWITNSGAADTVVGTDRDTYADVMLDNNIYQGADNVFANGTGAAQSNIERLDFVWSSGVSVISADGITVLERGGAGAHDAFQIAVITSLGSGLGSPLTWTFGNVLEVAATAYGSVNLDLNEDSVVDTIGYRLLRYNTGDTLTSHTSGNTTGSQGLAGVFISFADLGITTPTTVYGYALMATDVTNTSSNLADWSNATNYPTATADASGGIDISSFNGRMARVPEPSTYGALLLGVGALWIGWRRRALRSASLPRGGDQGCLLGQ